jgi:hypothetical protein
MNYSYYHKQFADNLSHNYNINEQDVLDYPDQYLGPNFREVMNLWFYTGSLSGPQWEVYQHRRRKLGEEALIRADNLSKKLASEVIDPGFGKPLSPINMRNNCCSPLP